MSDDMPELTRRVIENLPPGRELDHLVHTAIFRDPRCSCEHAPDGVNFDGDTGKCLTCDRGACPHYSTGYNAFGLLLEHITDWDYMKVVLRSSHYHGNACEIRVPDPSHNDCPIRYDAKFQGGESLPHALAITAVLSTIETRNPDEWVVIGSP